MARRTSPGPIKTGFYTFFGYLGWALASLIVFVCKWILVLVFIIWLINWRA